jgi:tetratricopeptide (TPR) repeat protein
VLGVSVVVLLLAGGLCLYYLANLARPDPVLAGARQLTAADLPAGLETASHDELRSKLDQLLAESLSEKMPEAWWSTRLSIEQCEDARRLALYLDDHQAAERSLLWLAHKLRYDQPPALALKYLQIAEDEAQEFGLDDEYASALLQEGRCLDNAGLSEWACQRFDLAYRSFLEQDNGRRAIYALLNSAMVNYNRLSRYDTAVEEFAHCAELAEQYDEPPARTLPNLSLWAIALTFSGRYEEASPVFARAVACAAELGDASKLQRQLNLQAETALCLGHNAQAEKLLTQAVALNPEVPDDAFGRYDSFFRLASFYQSVHRTDDALQVLEQALADISARRTAAQGDKDEERIVARLDGAKFDTLSTYGHVLFDSGQDDQAAKYYEQAAALSDKTNASFPSDRVDVQLAQVYMELGRYDDALSRLKDAEAHSLSFLSPALGYGDIAIALHEGQAYNELGEIELARMYIKRAAKACPPVYNVSNAVLYAAIQRAFGDLATLEDMRPEALDYYQNSYDVLSEVASGFQWNTPLRYGLDKEFYKTYHKLDYRLKKQGHAPEAMATVERCRAVQLAHEYLVAGAPTPDEKSRERLNDYRTATTYLDTLRGALLQLETSTPPSRLWPYTQYVTMSAYPWRYRREYVRQYTSLRRELKQKIAKAEADADACRQRLRAEAPQIAEIVDLKCTHAWWQDEGPAE